MQASSRQENYKTFKQPFSNKTLQPYTETETTTDRIDKKWSSDVVYLCIRVFMFIFQVRVISDIRLVAVLWLLQLLTVISDFHSHGVHFKSADLLSPF